MSPLARAAQALPIALWAILTKAPPVLRAWLWIALLGTAAAAGYRIFVSAPKEAQQAAEFAGAAKEHIDEARAAAAAGRDGDVQRLDAEALERAEALLRACGARCR